VREQLKGEPEPKWIGYAADKVAASTPTLTCAQCRADEVESERVATRAKRVKPEASANEDGSAEEGDAEEGAEDEEDKWYPRPWVDKVLADSRRARPEAHCDLSRAEEEHKFTH
jgi:hypothetical protein